LLECAVEIDGTVKRVRVVRSLDVNFGLDHEAVKAATQWQFQAGTRDGEPVPVVVVIELAFSILPADSLPVPFAATGPPSPAEWLTTSMQTPRLLAAIDYPETWTATSTEPSATVTVLSSDASAVAVVMPTIKAFGQRRERPTWTEARTVGSLLAAELRRPLVASGLSQVGGRTWTWIDLGSGEIDEPVKQWLPPHSALNIAHLWVFSTLAEGERVNVVFALRSQKSLDASPSEPVYHALTLGQLLERISLKAASTSSRPAR
jgi:TonB family protein